MEHIFGFINSGARIGFVVIVAPLLGCGGATSQASVSAQRDAGITAQTGAGDAAAESGATVDAATVAPPSDGGSTPPASDSGSTAALSDGGSTGALDAAGLCSGPRDVLVLQQPNTTPPITFTNFNSFWDVDYSSASTLSVNQSIGLPGVSFEFFLPTPGMPPPGVYGGNAVSYTFEGDGCGPQQGNVTVVTNTLNDAGAGTFFATFDLLCPNATSATTGCIRYQSEPEGEDAAVPPPESGYDAGVVDRLDAGPDGDDYLAPCLGHPLAFFVEGEPLSGTAAMWTEAEGEWAAGLYSGMTSVGVASAVGGASLRVAPDVSANAVASGVTYDAGMTSTPSAPYFDLFVNGVECNGPAGHFTVWEYEAPNAEQAQVSRLTVSFAVTCSNGPGTVRGCARYSAM